MIIKETWLDDEDYLDAGDIVYEGKAYYNKRYSGLAHSGQFSNASDMYDWVWQMCQDGYYVTVYDYEDSEYSYYRWPDNAKYIDLSSVEELETDERGNFLYIDDIDLYKEFTNPKVSSKCMCITEATESLPERLELWLQDFAQTYGDIDYTDISNLSRFWSSLNGDSRREIKKLITNIRHACNETGMDAYELAYTYP